MAATARTSRALPWRAGPILYPKRYMDGKAQNGPKTKVLVKAESSFNVGRVHQTHADVDLKDVYFPFAQATTRFASVYIRATGSSLQWLETLRAVVASIDADVF